jgi:nucleoside-diphosphate-sugar epimerase
MKERILVTGGAGFIGSNLVRGLLEADYPVLVVDNLSAGTRENVPAAAQFRKADLRDENLVQHLEGIETVFHLAAKNCLADCAANPVETAQINVMGTANLLTAAVKAGVRHVIYSDTSAEYEGVLDFPSRVENVKPLSIYACSKRGGALMCEAFSELHSLKTSFVRYFNVYGPAQDWRRVIPPVMSAFTRRLLQGEAPVIYGNGEKRRDFIHVDDINAFHLKLVREPALQGGTYNLGTGKDYSILEIFTAIEGQIKSGIQPIFKPDLPAEAFKTQADISTSLKTGWAPQVTLEEGIRRFIEYTKECLQKDFALSN